MNKGITLLQQTMFMVLGFWIFAVMLTPAWAADDPQLAGLIDNPQALLEETDRRHNPFEDQVLRVKMVLHGGSNDGREIEFTTYTKGENRRAVRMHNPPDIRGMGVVIKGNDEIYVRLPDSKKVRRVAAHAKKQSFMGTDYNFDDMAMIRLAPLYTAKIAKKDDNHIWLELALREGVDLQYEKLVIRLDRSRILYDEVLFFVGGTQVKRQSRSKPKQMPAGHTLYSHLMMTTVSSGHGTETHVLDEKINVGVKEKTFSRRWLSKDE